MTRAEYEDALEKIKWTLGQKDKDAIKRGGFILQHYSREIISALQLAMDSGWRDIESAPKDGKSILTYPHYIITHWHERGFWAGDYSEEIDDFKSLHRQPTHWMPLPEVPNED